MSQPPQESMMRNHPPSLSDAFPREIGRALATMGDYVYGYYRPGEVRPFYVGKGKGSRVLSHWKLAIAAASKPHEKEILSILKGGEMPVVKLLAYHLEKTGGSCVYSAVERVLQDAFGIQKVWEKRGGKERLVEHEAGLLQSREDSANSPVLSLEAVLAKADVRRTMALKDIAEMVGAPILLVGLSKTYHPSYSATQVSEMARMYWNLDRFANTALPVFRKAEAPVLLAWSSLIGKTPMIVGAWRARPGLLRPAEAGGRYVLNVTDQEDLPLRRLCLGIRLPGTGNNWQGPRFAFPSGAE